MRVMHKRGVKGPVAPFGGRTYTIDSHPQKKKIVQWILDGRTVRDIGANVVPPVPFAVVQRYKSNIIKPALSRAVSNGAPINGKTSGTTDKSGDTATQAAKNAAQDSPVLSIFRQRLEKLYRRADGALDHAEAKKDLGVMAPLLNQAHKNLELLGKATGELADSSAPSVAIQIVCPSAPTPELTPRITYAAQDELVSQPVEEIGLLQRPE